MRLLIFLLLLIPPSVSAQHFDWAASGSELANGIRASAIDKQGNIIVAFNATFPDYLRSMPGLYTSVGDSITDFSSGDPLAIISFRPDGHINWQVQLPYGGEPIGLVVNDRQEVSLLAIADTRSGTHFTDFDSSGIDAAWQPDEKDEESYPDYIDYQISADPGTAYIYTLSRSGKPLRVAIDTNEAISSPVSFKLIEGNKYVIALDNPHKIVKMDSMLNIEWEHTVENSGGGLVQSDALEVSPRGDIFYTVCQSSVNFGDGYNWKSVKLDDGRDSYETFLACYSAQGKLKWAKRSGGRSFFSSLAMNGQWLVAGGEILDNGVFFGLKADTAGGKNMVLASFDLKGNIQWVRTSNAEKVTALTTDRSGNIYAAVNCYKQQYRQGRTPFVVYETDTLDYAFETMVISSYSPTGQFRWVKNYRIGMNNNNLPQLLTDACGNIYVSGEMWNVMFVKYKWLDVAFTRGQGSGGSPFLVKLKNTLPGINRCVISPAPWKISSEPNPFSISTRIRYHTTYADRVSIELYDVTGKFIRTILKKNQVPPGDYSITFNSDGLSKGTYILVLQGTESLSTHRIIVQ
jgi:hypothetical protein